jgi:hypothetical protein
MDRIIYLTRVLQNLKPLLLLCAFIQIPLAMTYPTGCFPPPFFESYFGFGVGISIAAIGVCLNSLLGKVGALGLSGLLFYTHFYLLPIQFMEISHRGVSEKWNEVIRFWMEQVQYHQTYVLQVAFAWGIFCCTAMCLASSIFLKRTASMWEALSRRCSRL